MAGKGAIGEGERAYRAPAPPPDPLPKPAGVLLEDEGRPVVNAAGDPGAFDEKDERREEPSIGGGGNMKAGVLLTEVAGVSGAPPPGPISSVRSSAELPASLAIDARRPKRGRPPAPPCALGVRECALDWLWE